MKMDVLFLHSREKGWKDRLARAREVLGEIKVIEGEGTILGSFEKCFREAQTELFVMIDGDNIVFENARDVLATVDKPSIFKATNDFGVCYGHGGIKVLSRKLDLKQVFSEGYFLDVSVHLNMETRDEVLSHHDFCFSPYNEWKSIFRELLKLHLQEENNWYTKEMLASWLKAERPVAVYRDVLHFCANAGLYDYGRINEADFIADLYTRAKTVAVAAICKNEQERVAGFLEQLKDFDAIHILDTGSTDDTVAKIERHMNERTHLHREAFDDLDFSAFRNALLKKDLRYDAIVWLDFDELLIDFDMTAFKREIFITKEDAVAYSVARREADPSYVSNMHRVFKDQSGFWQHAVHEEYRFEGTSAPVFSMTLKHENEPSSLKNDFYIQLLENSLKSDPEHALFYLAHHLDLERSSSDLIALVERYHDVIEAMPPERYVPVAIMNVAARYRHLRTVDDETIERILATVRNRSVCYRLADILISTRKDISHRFLAHSLLTTLADCDEGDHTEIAYTGNAYDAEALDRLRSRL